MMDLRGDSRHERLRGTAGMTPYAAKQGRSQAIGRPRWAKVFGVVAAILFLLFVVKHLAGAGMGNH